MREVLPQEVLHHGHGGVGRGRNRLSVIRNLFVCLFGVVDGLGYVFCIVAAWYVSDGWGYFGSLGRCLVISQPVTHS